MSSSLQVCLEHSSCAQSHNQQDVESACAPSLDSGRRRSRSRMCTGRPGPSCRWWCIACSVRTGTARASSCARAARMSAARLRSPPPLPPPSSLSALSLRWSRHERLTQRCLPLAEHACGFPNVRSVLIRQQHCAVYGRVRQ